MKKYQFRNHHTSKKPVKFSLTLAIMALLMLPTLGLAGHTFEDKFIQIGELKFHYITKGEPGNPLLLFIHGAPERAEAWTSYLKYFGKKGYYAVAYSTRGSYPSSIPQDVAAYTSEHRAADAVNIAHALGYTKFSIIAHDWGASAAWSAAAAYPDAIERLVIFSTPHPIVYSRGYYTVPEHRKKLDAYIPLIRDGIAPWNRAATLQNNAEHFRNIVFTDLSEDFIPNRTKQKYLETWLYNQGESIDGTYNHYKALSWPLPNIPSCQYVPSLIVKQPVLLFYGVQDPYVGAGIYGPNDCNPNTEYVRFSLGDHWIHHEYKGFSMVWIEKFLHKTNQGMAQPMPEASHE